MDQCLDIGREQVCHFQNSLPDGFYKPLSKHVKMMAIVQKAVQVIDTSLIYSRVIAMQLTDEAMKVENLFQV